MASSPPFFGLKKLPQFSDSFFSRSLLLSLTASLFIQYRHISTFILLLHSANVFIIIIYLFLFYYIINVVVSFLLWFQLHSTSLCMFIYFLQHLYICISYIFTVFLHLFTITYIFFTNYKCFWFSISLYTASLGFSITFYNMPIYVCFVSIIF
jgi:hypothetical protein